MKYFFVLLLSITTRTTHSQEALLNDIRACPGLYWIKGDLVKQISKEKDTINYYHDEELAIYYNREKTKELSPNTFYIINHGFNKLFSMRVLYFMVELSDNKRKKDTFINNPGQYLQAYHEDSLPRGRYTTAGLTVYSSYKNFVVKSLFVEIKYYDKIIYRWFLKEHMLADLLPKPKLVIDPL